MKHDHPIPAGHAHGPRPVRPVGPSLFRVSAGARLGLALAVSSLLWAAIGLALA